MIFCEWGLAQSSPLAARVFMQSECVYNTCRVGKVACKMGMALRLFYRLFAVDPSTRQLVFTANYLCLGKLAHGMLKLNHLTFYVQAVDLKKGCHICSIELYRTLLQCKKKLCSVCRGIHLSHFLLF